MIAYNIDSRGNVTAGNVLTVKTPDKDLSDRELLSALLKKAGIPVLCAEEGSCRITHCMLVRRRCRNGDEARDAADAGALIGFPPQPYEVLAVFAVTEYCVYDGTPVAFRLTGPVRFAEISRTVPHARLPEITPELVRGLPEYGGKTTDAIYSACSAYCDAVIPADADPLCNDKSAYVNAMFCPRRPKDLYGIYGAVKEFIRRSPLPYAPSSVRYNRERSSIDVKGTADGCEYASSIAVRGSDKGDMLAVCGRVAFCVEDIKPLLMKKEFLTEGDPYGDAIDKAREALKKFREKENGYGR